MTLASLLACLVPLSLAILFLKQALSAFIRKGRAEKLPPGPTMLPIIGNLHILHNTRTPLHRTLFLHSRKHGPLMFLKLGTVPTVVVSSAEAAKEFMSTHDLDCCSRPYQTSTAKLTYNFLDVGFSPYGPHWRDMRRLFIAEYTGPKRIRLNRLIREDEVRRMISSISSSSGQVVDLRSALGILSADASCRAAFGRREAGRLLEILKEMQAVLAGLFCADYLPSLGWLDSLTGMRGRLEKVYSALDSFYEEVIEEHMDPARRRVDDGEGDTVDAMLRIQDDGANLTKGHIKAVIMNIFLGSIDTNRVAMEWAMSELMRNPRAMEKAQNEVRSVLGKKGNAEESDLPQLHYLRCVVKEVLRLHPPGPLLVHREAMRGFNIGRFHIPAKTKVIINAWAIGREEGNWTKQEEFCPERFIDSNVDMKGNDFQFIPFGAGRRMCPGMQLALVTVELALANLLYSFNWELPEGMTDVDMDEGFGITIGRKNALLLLATKYDAMDG